MDASKHEKSFGLVLGGKLSLKGVEEGLEKKKKKKKRKHREEGADGGSDDEFVAPEWSDTPLPGAGKLTTSGVVVMGHGTRFDAELSIGDTLLVTVTDRYRNTSMDEARVINMVLGKGAINLEQPFSCDVSSPAAFLYVRKPPDLEVLKAARAESNRKARAAQEDAKEVTYKVIKTGSGPWASWKNVTEKVAGGLSREDMLDKRSMMKADRFCK